MPKFFFAKAEVGRSLVNTDCCLVAVISQFDRRESEHQYQVDNTATWCSRVPGYMFSPKKQLCLRLSGPG